jgi:cytoskeletal protein CcmA (bactofilin family)
MFRKKTEEETVYERTEPGVPTSPDVRRRKTSVIGPTLKIRGELSANEDLIIEGDIEGTIAHQDKNLTVGKEGRVKADINARTVEIYGKVEGDIHGEDIVKLAKSANVKGNIFCARIILEDGAQFSGRIDMSQKKKAPSKPTSLPIAESNKQIESAG